jgi:phosphatidylglycerol---prolipoprotein diacylglyceryl transferase
MAASPEDAKAAIPAFDHGTRRRPGSLDSCGVILGGRIGYVLIYGIDQYTAHPLDAFELWKGGMSFHGGALGVPSATFLYARRRGLNGLRILDYIVVVQPIGQCLGRIANFLNVNYGARRPNCPEV